MDPRTETVTVRLSPGELERLRAAAARMDVSPGTLVRRSLTELMFRLREEAARGGAGAAEDPELVARRFE